MEENINTGQIENKPSPFYPPPEEKSKKAVILILTIFIGALIIGFLFIRSRIKSLVTEEASPTPFATPTLTPTPTSSPLIRSDWSLEVLNGSGVSGLAKKIASELRDLGYPVVKVGNADQQTYQTTEIFVRSELMDKIDLVVADLRDIVKIASVSGELEEGTASARIILGKD